MSLTLHSLAAISKNHPSSTLQFHSSYPSFFTFPKPLNSRFHLSNPRFSFSQTRLLAAAKFDSSFQEPYGVPHGSSGTSFDAILSAVEFLSLVTSAAAVSGYIVVRCQMQRGGALGLFESKILVWQCVVLVGGLIAGALIRRRHLGIQALEARRLEKLLGTRFRITRQKALKVTTQVGFTTYQEILQVYIVYLGEHTGQKTGEEVEKEHHSYLLSVKNSLEEAKSSVIYSYKNVINGFAAFLTPQEATAISEMEGVISVFKDKPHKVHTMRSWDFISLLESEWDPTTADGLQGLLNKANSGADVIAGLLDTGIRPESKSFDDTGMGNIRTPWKGCNKKTLTVLPRNMNGHGTHVSSILGGRCVANASVAGGLGKGTARGHAAKRDIVVCCSPGNAGPTSRSVTNVAWIYTRRNFLESKHGKRHDQITFGTSKPLVDGFTHEEIAQPYIVYLEEHTTQKPRKEVEEEHLSYLRIVKNSLQEAKSSIIYSYTNVINGFVAFLTPQEATALSEVEGVISVFKDSKASINVQGIKGFYRG